MIEFGQRVLEGLGAAGWVLGLLTGLGVILVIVGLFGYALMRVFGQDEDEEQEDE